MTGSLQMIYWNIRNKEKHGLNGSIDYTLDLDRDELMHALDSHSLDHLISINKYILKIKWSRQNTVMQVLYIDGSKR